MNEILPFAKRLWSFTARGQGGKVYPQCMVRRPFWCALHCRFVFSEGDGVQ
jgi:hypothetical protein